MNINFLEKDKLLLLELTEEIDHHCIEKLRGKMDNEFKRYMPKKIILDFNKVSFMDSSGIGMLIGRYKLANIIGSQMEIKNTKSSVRKILEMSGISKIISIIEEEKSEEVI